MFNFTEDMLKDLKVELHEAKCVEDLANGMVKRGWVKLATPLSECCTESAPERNDKKDSEQNYKCPWNPLQEENKQEQM